MKKLSKILVLVFIMLCIPLLISCGSNSTSNIMNEENYYKITFDINSECFEGLNCPEKLGEIYAVEVSDFKDLYVAYIETNGVNILENIKQDTEVNFNIYLMPFSNNVEIKINDSLIDYDISEKNGYQVLEFSFVMNNNVNLYMNGWIEAL